MKRPTVINISLHALRDLPKRQENPPLERGDDSTNKNNHNREEPSMQHLITFLKIVAQQRHKQPIDGPRGGKEAGKQQGRIEREDTLHIPLAVCASLDALIRKYLLFRAQERSEPSRPKPKLPLDRSNHPKGLRTNKENEALQDQQRDEALPFRSISSLEWDRQRLIGRNRQLQAEAMDLRQRLKEKNTIILKMAGKESQLKRKYNDEMARLLRNRNICNISQKFQREEEEGQGRNALNIAGKTINEPHLQLPPKDSQEERATVYTKSHLSPAIKTLGKSQSEYTKDGRVRVGKSKAKLHPFRPSPRTPSPCLSPATQFLKTINKSLPTQCINRREDALKGSIREKTELQSLERTTFQLYVDHLESSGVREQQGTQIIPDEEFQALQMQGFYNEDTLKQMDARLKI